MIDRRRRAVGYVAVVSAWALATAWGSTAHAAPAMARQACTPQDATVNQCVLYPYTGATKTFIVPAGVTEVKVQTWGAGGGGFHSDLSPQYGGGAGAYSFGAIAVTPGQAITVLAGQGGLQRSTATTFGGGGAGGAGPSFEGSSGGGMSAVSLGPLTAATALVIAGGGGGGSPGTSTVAPNDARGGGGGGANGGQDATNLSGDGGTQVAGGLAETSAGNCPVISENGAQFIGGRGASATAGSTAEGGGGGGGGWFGGGGGNCQTDTADPQNGAGGGGSGYISGPGVSVAQTLAGETAVAIGTKALPAALARSNVNYQPFVGEGGIGVGAGGGAGGGGNGQVVIQWLQSSDLSLTKTSAPEYTPGTEASYTITVTNAGPAPVTGAPVTDTVPAGLLDATWTCTATAPNICGEASGSGNIATTVNLVASGTATFVVTGMTAPDADEPLVNSAAVTVPAGTTDPNTGDNTGTSTIAPGPPHTSVTVVKTAAPDPYVPGSAFSYLIVVTNGGASTATMQVQDTLPAALQAFTWTCTAAGAGTTCGAAEGVGNIDLEAIVGPGGTVTILVEGTIPIGTTGPLLNTATATLARGTVDGGCPGGICKSTVEVAEVPVTGDKLAPMITIGGAMIAIGGLILFGIRRERRPASGR